MWQPIVFSQTLAQVAGDAPAPTAPAADGTTQTPGDPNQPNTQAQGPGSAMVFVMIAVFVGVMLLSSMSGRKQKKKTAELMAALSKGDRVQTIGGILGTIVEVRENDVLLKVDENANTKMRFVKSAVQNVLESKSDAKNSEKEDAPAAE